MRTGVFCCPFKFLLLDQEEDIETKLQSKNQINRTNIKAKNPVLRKCWLSKKRNANCGLSTEPLHCRKKDFGFMFYPWIPINPPITQVYLVTPMIPYFWFLGAFALKFVIHLTNFAFVTVNDYSKVRWVTEFQLTNFFSSFWRRGGWQCSGGA